jgi:hypothetical protein
MTNTREKCPLCNQIAKHTQQGTSVLIKCSDCGEFIITHQAILDLDKYYKVRKDWYSELGPLLSYTARKACGKRTFDTQTLRKIIENEKLPTVSEQADLLILWLGDNLKDPGATTDIDLIDFKARIGARSSDNVEFIMDGLNGKIIEQKNLFWRLTFAGWERYGKLKRKGIETNRAFMAMQYDSIKDVPEGYAISEPEWSKMFDIFKAEVKKTGFILYLLKDKPEAGLIDDRMLVEIRNSKFTVADLTFGNQGAYWESGFAEGLEKKVIYTCEKKWFDDKKTHFDTNHRQTIIWERGNVQEAAEKLKATIRNSFPVDAKMTDD